MKLDIKEIHSRIKFYPSWEIKKTGNFQSLRRIFLGFSYKEYLKFLNKIGLLSEKLGHHPKIILEYSKLTVEIYTHSEQGITELDFHFIKKLEQILDKFSLGNFKGIL